MTAPSGAPRIIIGLDNCVLLHGDSRRIREVVPDGYVDAVVCDPPYELGFMGKSWDGTGVAYDPDFWRTILAVLKPGGHLLAFGGTRTYHRMACAIEDAGFEIRDSLHWTYGSGFPKSLDVSKAVDAAIMCGSSRPEDLRRQAMGDDYKPSGRGRVNYDHGGGSVMNGARRSQTCVYLKAGQPCQGHDSGNSQAPTVHAGVTAPGSPEAARWQGWGTALKPAHEPIILARKPLGATVAACALAHGTGALNIDACRIGNSGGTRSAADSGPNHLNEVYGNGMGGLKTDPSAVLGRWPANVIFSHGPGCEVVGTREVRGSKLNHECTGGAGTSYVLGTRHKTGHTDENGMETVDAYRCEPGCPVAELDQQSGRTRSQPPERGRKGKRPGGFGDVGAPTGSPEPCGPQYGDEGGASRFFACFPGESADPSHDLDLRHSESDPLDGPPFRYVAKPSTRERDDGLDHLPVRSGGEATDRSDGSAGLDSPRAGAGRRGGRRNVHPTVKPIALMRWLCRLVARPGGVILDPFCGSGSTGVAALAEGFKFIGSELTDEYLPIIVGRLEHALRATGKEDKK